MIRLTALLLSVASLLAPALPAAAPPAQSPFNVRDFGATGDGTTKDTAAFQKALDTCAVHGGGEVLVPAGKYLIGSIQLGTRTLLRLAPDSILTGSPDLADYPLVDIRWEGRWQPGHRALIYAANVDHTGIVGPGLIEGNPTTAASNRPPRGTLVLEPINCTDVRWEDFSVRQTGNNWATHPTYCTDVVIQNVTIYGGRDGIDLDSCNRVRVEGCVINTGDDAISLKSGRGMDGARIGRPTEDVLITHCTLTGRRFACIGIGSEISAGVRNIRIEHCTFTSASHAIYLKTRIGRAGVTENLSGDDLTILAGGFLRLNLTVGGNTNTSDDPVEGLIGYPSAKNLSFANVRLTNATVVVDATQTSPAKPIEGLSLVNVTGTAKKGLALANIVGVTLRDLHITGVEGPLLATENVTGTGLEQAADLPGRVTLWNGTNLTGWKLFLGDATTDPATAWNATDGILRLHTTASGYLRTEKTFSNYRLHAEWRWPKDAPANSNSGVLLHVHGDDAVWPLCFEAQLKTGNAGQIVGLGLDIPAAPLQANRKRAPRLADVSEKPHGEWNAYDLYVSKDTIEAYVNGVRQNRVEQLPATAGAIALQLEGFPVEFRHLWLRPL